VIVFDSQRPLHNEIHDCMASYFGSLNKFSYFLFNLMSSFMWKLYFVFIQSQKAVSADWTRHAALSRHRSSWRSQYRVTTTIVFLTLFPRECLSATITTSQVKRVFCATAMFSQS